MRPSLYVYSEHGEYLQILTDDISEEDDFETIRLAGLYRWVKRHTDATPAYNMAQAESMAYIFGGEITRA